VRAKETKLISYSRPADPYLDLFLVVPMLPSSYGTSSSVGTRLGLTRIRP